jgi:hypothetical protein
MPLSPSWKTHFLQGLAPLNAIGDRNMSKYTEAMTYNAAVDTKMKYLNKDHNLILVADHKKQVIILHNLKNYGGTILQPDNKVAALLGLGPNAHVVTLNASTAVTAQSKRTQSAADIIAAATIGTDTLRALRAPTGCETNYHHITMFTPAPFIRKAILKAMTPCPFELIQAAATAHTAFIQEHEGTDGFDATPYDTHRDNFMMWCLAVGQESIPECCFSILPDDDDLNRHKTNTHRDYILPTLKQAAALPANPNDTVDVLRQLGATMARSSEAAKAQNATQREQLDYMKEKDNKKKDKAEK